MLTDCTMSVGVAPAPATWLCPDIEPALLPEDEPLDPDDDPWLLEDAEPLWPLEELEPLCGPWPWYELPLDVPGLPATVPVTRTVWLTCCERLTPLEATSRYSVADIPLVLPGEDPMALLEPELELPLPL